MVLVVRCLPETIGIYLQAIQLFHRRNDRYVKMYGCYLVVFKENNATIFICASLLNEGHYFEKSLLP